MTPEDLRDLLTFARVKARECVKEQWRREGVKLLEWSQPELRIESERYLAELWGELRPKAEEMLAYVKTYEKKRKASKSTASTVHNSRTKVEADQ